MHIWFLFGTLIDTYRCDRRVRIGGSRMINGKRFRVLLHFLLVGFFVGLMPSTVEASYFDAWYKLATRKSLNHVDVEIVRGTLACAAILSGVSLMVRTLSVAMKRERKLKRAIQEGDNDFVRNNISLFHKAFLGQFVYYAVYNKNVEALKLLLEHGAFTEVTQGILGTTPLVTALTNNDFESARLLLGHGADPLAHGQDRIRAIDYAYKNEELAKLMREKIEERGLKAMDRYASTFVKKDLNTISLFARMKQNFLSVFKKKQEGVQ